MAKFDYDKFLKFMRLTASPFDNEALSAIKLANQMLRAYGIVWDEVTREPSSQVGPIVWTTRVKNSRKPKTEAFKLAKEAFEKCGILFEVIENDATGASPAIRVQGMNSLFYYIPDTGILEEIQASGATSARTLSLTQAIYRIKKQVGQTD
jgi:hypothetical protein